jgi:hypothetical protein
MLNHDEILLLQKAYVETASTWGNCVIDGNHKTANRMNRGLIRLRNKINRNSDLATEVLLPLLDHNDPAVRLSAATDMLQIGISQEKAELTLFNLSNNPNIHVLQLMAKINLSMWEEKKEIKT